MHCYFHLVKGEAVLSDDTGVPVSSIEMARGEALRAIREMLQEDPDAPDEWSGWRLDVVDTGGNVLVSIDLGEIEESSYGSIPRRLHG